jgi:hypothetical protein
VEHTTPSGWYIKHQPAHRDYHPIYYIQNKSFDFEINSYDKLYQYYLDMLEELPDPAKIYTTVTIFTKKQWKLTYVPDTKLLQWVNQNDNTTQPFIIQTPLKIGDTIAK